jgi:hypothetical protein
MYMNGQWLAPKDPTTTKPFSPKQIEVGIDYHQRMLLGKTTFKLPGKFGFGAGM